jgi:hypothetical protein
MASGFLTPPRRNEDVIAESGANNDMEKELEDYLQNKKNDNQIIIDKVPEAVFEPIVNIKSFSAEKDKSLLFFDN